MLADRWWAAAVAPGAVGFVTRWALLSGLLEAAGLLAGAAWFVGNLLVVARAIGSVELPRQIGDLEIREAVPPAALFAFAAVAGTLLGLLAGSGGSGYTGAILLAWHGLQFGLPDPVLHHDASVYVAQLPLWLAALRFGRVLVFGAAGIVAVAYAALGALRVGRGGIAITDYARRHVGLLAAAGVGLLAVGTALLPLRAVARLGAGAAFPTPFEIAMAGTLAMVACAAAALVGWWAVRGRPSSVIAGLITTALVITARAVLPAIGAPMVDPSDVRAFTVAAWDLGLLDQGAPELPAPVPSMPAGAGLWPAGLLLPAAGPGDRVAAASRGAVIVDGHPRRAWLLLRAAADSAVLSVVADDQVNAAGGPLSYRAADPLAYPGITTYGSLAAGALWPGAPDWMLARTGIPVGGAARRLALAWAAQAGALLGRGVTDSSRLGWRLDPTARLAALFPPARWSEPQLILAGGRVVWAVRGSLPYYAFPLAPRTEVLGADAGGADAGLLGVVDAASGVSRLYLTPGAGPVARAWADLADGAIGPADSIPAGVVARLAYPAPWLAIQARVLAGATFALPPVAVDSGDLVRPVPVWDATAPVLEIPFVDPAPPGRVVALLVGAVHAGRLTPRLVRIPEAATLPGPRRLERSWTGFPSYGQLVDSLQAAGGRAVSGPVQYDWRGGRLEAAQLSYRSTPASLPALLWANVAVDRRLGGGRDLPGAWANLLGQQAPLVPNPGASSRLAQARLWVERADSALRRGDLAAFTRAFTALKELVEEP